MEWHRVPTALRSELTEYISLLRALRLNNILDLSEHLTRHGRADSSSSDSLSDDSDDPDGPTSAAYTYAKAIPGTKRKRSHSSGPFRKRDSWTRWPLMLTDLHKPTWSFDDEVAAVASQAEKLFLAPFAPPTEPPFPRSSNEHSEKTSLEDCDDEQGDTDDTDDADDADEPSYYRAIGVSGSTFLSNILMLLSLHIPPRPPSMQNRIEPLDWRSVLEIVSVYGDTGVVDEQLLKLEWKLCMAFRRRLEIDGENLSKPLNLFNNTYSKNSKLSTYRLRKKTESKLRSESMMSQALDSLSTLAKPPSDFFTRPHVPSSAERKKAGKKVKTTNKSVKKIKSVGPDVASDESEDMPLAMVKERRKAEVPKVKPSENLGY